MLVGPESSDYVEDVNGDHDGPMSAAQYAGSDAQALSQLHHDGFITGYVRTWLDQAHQHLMIEAVVAFGGHRDAVSWLATVKANSADEFYVRPIVADGVDSFFGRHYADPTQPIYSDVGVFLKGNDFFFVGLSSQADDLDGSAATQAKRQFDAAPAYSISPSLWPENAMRGPLGLNAATVPLAVGSGGVLITGILLMLLAFAVLARSRGRLAAPPLATAGRPAVHMSEDGRYWWDGESWRDTSSEAPPDALRSADGFYWWDTRTWRRVPPAS